MSFWTKPRFSLLTVLLFAMVLILLNAALTTAITIQFRHG
jgi:hypothetical protein